MKKNLIKLVAALMVVAVSPVFADGKWRAKHAKEYLTTCSDVKAAYDVEQLKREVFALSALFRKNKVEEKHRMEVVTKVKETMKSYVDSSGTTGENSAFEKEAALLLGVLLHGDAKINKGSKDFGLEDRVERDVAKGSKKGLFASIEIVSYLAVAKKHARFYHVFFKRKTAEHFVIPRLVEKGYENVKPLVFNKETNKYEETELSSDTLKKVLIGLGLGALGLTVVGGAVAGGLYLGATLNKEKDEDGKREWATKEEYKEYAKNTKLWPWNWFSNEEETPEEKPEETPEEA